MPFESAPHSDASDGLAEDSVSKYLSEKHATLANDYRTPDGKYSESCTLIAADVAKLLLAGGKKPHIVSVRGTPVSNSSFIATEPLFPVQYSGRVRWGGHVVCVYDGLVYDPMVGRTVPLDQYGKEAFGADVTMKTIIAQDAVEQFVSR